MIKKELWRIKEEKKNYLGSLNRSFTALLHLQGPLSDALTKNIIKLIWHLFIFDLQRVNYKMKFDSELISMLNWLIF
jgi:hypothetical protein